MNATEAAGIPNRPLRSQREVNFGIVCCSEIRRDEKESKATELYDKSKLLW
jgi:hypothetical protein